ncbi:metal ABC transporter substrate-binding protein [Oerskovia flava]|uniref:metal ABC transporter substrate-binding protein n=1 Tax=Oerskovia flava TaxID=2986422 RepID=UPI0022409411|nr:metal ABC transporter substrate-binding protein [Oerskovia sp. JB1-3-2]
MTRRLAAASAAVTLLAVAVLTGCSTDDGTGTGTAAGADETAEASGGDVQVLASFYPLQYVAEQIGGDRVTVSNLTPPAADPHDLELAPAQVRVIGDADLVVYLSGFQPAVDEAIAAREPAHVVDAAGSAGLEERSEDTHSDDHSDDHGDDEHGDDHDHDHDHGDGDDEHAEEVHADEDEHDHGALDPHFWLDPTRLAAVADEVATELTAVDPDGAEEYTTAAAALVEGLTALDEEFTEGLATCESRVLVTSHEAFGYLADRYDLEQVGIAGIDPEGEPAPARLREVADVIRANDVQTIFFETLASPRVTQALADDVGVATDVLDPLEGLTDPAEDYVGVMRGNLEALRDGLSCS